MASRSQTPPQVDPEAALAGLCALSREKLPPAEPDPEAARHRTFARLRERLGEDARGRSRRRLWLGLGLAGAVAAGLVPFVVKRLSAPEALAYTVEGEDAGGAVTGGYLRAPADAETAVHFSDGSAVTLGKASRGRVAATHARGARVVLEQGSARVHVVPARGNDWIFDAGPCLVHVTGTKFDLQWSAGEQILEVRLHEGSVQVEGPPAPRGIALREGQRLLMNVRDGSARLDQLPGTLRASPALPPSSRVPTPVVEEPEAEPAAAPALPSERPPPAQRGAHGPAPSHAATSWSERVLGGDFSGVLREARRRGIDDVLARGGPGDVMALGEAARHLRETALARRALSAVRSRFPRSAPAQKATFLLGRMAEDNEGDLVTALSFYTRYLEGAPRGAYRDEALGRRMAAVLKLKGAAEARPLAEQYLQRFPAGAYAEPARAILKAAW